MRIQHNIMAMSAYRNYTNNVSAMKKNLEKLSSGYKINRAGDDAAGLAISEKMRAQITGLETAQKNAKDGISLVQTAEGALTEVHDMLNRMVELATMSANGTYDNETDRAQLQKEVDQLRDEIDRIADSANFNGIKLLDGSMDGTVSTTTTEYTSGKNNIPILQEVATNPTEEVGTKTVLHVDGSTTDKKTSFKVELHNVNLVGEHGDTVTVTIGDQELSFTFDKDVSSSTATPGKLKAGTVNATDFGDAIAAAWNNGTKLIKGQEFNISASNGTLTFTQANTPTNVGEVVAPCKEVQIDFKSNKAESTQTTQLNTAQKNALVKSQKLVINGTEYDFAVTTATATSFTANCGDYTVKYDNGKLQVVAPSGADTVSSIAIAAQAATGNVDGASAGVGAAATAASSGAVTIGTSAFSAVSSTKITFLVNGTSTSITFDDTQHTSDTLIAVTINGVAYNLERTGAGATTFTLTAATAGEAGNQNVVCVIQQHVNGVAKDPVVAAVDIANGADQAGGKAAFYVNPASVNVGETIEFNGTKFTVETNVADTLKKIAAYAQSTFGDLYDKVEASGETLTITAKFTTNGDTAAGGAVLKYGGTEETALTMETVPSNSAKDGTWNVKTTENQPGAVSGAGVLASTTFKLNSGIVKDKNTLTIGNKTFTFKVGKNSTATGDNIIDLSDLNEGDADLVEKAAERLSQQTHDVFTIGYDKEKPGEISIHEKANQTIYTNGELSEVSTFDELVYFNSAKDESVTETTTAGGRSLTLQIGDTADDFNQLVVNVKDMHAAAIGIGDISIADQESAAKAVDAIKAAINYVSDVRGTLGATQNRLDHTINNLSVMTENIQDAESTIRDVDVAEEMMAYTKNNILIQSAQAMLAQANQVPQGVLQLLQ